MTWSDPRPAAEPSSSAIATRAARGAMLLGARAVVLRALSFASTIVLARLLVPADFGVYGVIGAVATLVMVFGDVGLAGALIRQEGAPTATQLRTVWTVQLSLAGAGIVILWALAPLATIVPGFPVDADAMVRIISISVLLSAARAHASLRLERDLRFGPYALGDVLGQVTFASTAIVLAVRGAGAWSFILASVAQQAALTAVVARAGFRWPGIGLDRHAFGSLVRFGLRFQAAWVLAWARDGVVPAIVGLVRGAQAAGFVNFGLRLSLLVSSFDEIVGRLAFPTFSRLRDGGRDLRSATGRAAALTALVVVPAQLWVATTAPTLVPFVFSDRWLDAVVPIQLLCVAMTARIPVRYIRQATFAAGASGAGLRISALDSALPIALLVPGALIAGASGAAAAVLVGALVALVPAVRLAPPGVGVDWRVLGRIYFAGATAATAGALMLGLAGGVAGLAASAVAAAIVHAGLVRLLAAPTLRLALDLVHAGGR